MSESILRWCLCNWKAFKWILFDFIIIISKRVLFDSYGHIFTGIAAAATVTLVTVVAVAAAFARDGSAFVPVERKNLRLA